MSNTTYPCPLCGKDRNRRGDLFADPSRTAAHINGSHDDVHAGERGEDNMNDIRAGERTVEQIDDSEGQAAEQTPAVADGAGGPSPDGADDTVPIEIVDGMEDELAAANRRIRELEEEVDGLNSLAEELSAKVPDGLERCPECDEPLGLRDNFTGSVIECTECGGGPWKITADS